MAEEVVVMHRGRVMESGSAEAMLRAPAHPYTKQLFDAAPSVPAVAALAEPLPEDDLILQMKSVSKTYKMRASSSLPSKWLPAPPSLAPIAERSELVLGIASRVKSWLKVPSNAPLT